MIDFSSYVPLSVSVAVVAAERERFIQLFSGHLSTTGDPIFFKDIEHGDSFLYLTVLFPPSDPNPKHRLTSAVLFAKSQLTDSFNVVPPSINPTVRVQATGIVGGLVGLVAVLLVLKLLK